MEDTEFHGALARSWWAVALQGFTAVLFAIVAFASPAITLAVLALWFGAYALVHGVFSIVASIRAVEERRQWWPLLVEGLFSAAVGVVTFFWPAITVLALVYLVAAWATLTGIFRIAAAVRLRREITGEWLLVVGGAASILFGLVVAAFPVAGAITLVRVLGIFLAVFGVLLIALGFRLRGEMQHHLPGKPSAI